MNGRLLTATNYDDRLTSTLPTKSIGYHREHDTTPPRNINNDALAIDVYRTYLSNLSTELSDVASHIITKPSRDHSELFDILASHITPTKYDELLLNVESKCRLDLLTKGYTLHQLQTLDSLLRYSTVDNVMVCSFAFVFANDDRLQPISKHIEQMVPVIHSALVIARDMVRLKGVFGDWTRELSVCASICIAN